MYEIGILVIYVQGILEHTEDETRDGENLGKGTEPEWTRESDEEGNCQHGEKYPPFLAP